MSTATASTASEMAIFRRIVDSDLEPMSKEAARGILRLGFSPADRDRMNALAAKSRVGQLSIEEDEELSNYIRVGQSLGILRSKARRALKSARASKGRKPGKS